MVHRSIWVHFWCKLCSIRWGHCVIRLSHWSEKMICSSWCWEGKQRGKAASRSFTSYPGQAPGVTWAVSLCQLPRPWDLDRLMKDRSNNFPFHHSRHKGIQTALCQNGNLWYLFSEEKSTVVLIGGCLGMTGTVCPSWTVTARGSSGTARTTWSREALLKVGSNKNSNDKIPSVFQWSLRCRGARTKTMMTRTQTDTWSADDGDLWP